LAELARRTTMMQSHERSTSGHRGHAVPEALAVLPASPHICSECSKRFVVVSGDAGSEAARCPCGGALAPAALAAGVYEVRAAKRRKGAAKKAPGSVRRPDSAMPVEADLGYNESHGYGPSHGGPTGPGDAPADAPDLPAPKDGDQSR
jgi:hypothetical protein